MKIIIHRGINRIGGCITEIAAGNTRILIDLGQNLPDNEGKIDDMLGNPEQVEELTKNINALFYTHYHGDHLGYFSRVPDTVDQYIGSVAKEVVLCKTKRLSLIKSREELSKRELDKLKKMKTFIPAQTLLIKNEIKITPYLVSHSAYDSYMFLIETENKRILHTGDFREHGYLGSRLFSTLKKHILKKGKIDFLITEGTMISRQREKIRHEKELNEEMTVLMKKYKNVFIICSSTDMERLASCYSANKKLLNRPFVCDDYQKEVLLLFSDTAGNKSKLFKFEKVYSFNRTNYKLINWMREKGFCMLVRPTEKFKRDIDFLQSHINMNESILIYSMWKAYILPGNKHVREDHLSFTKMFPVVQTIHTSGHASATCLARVCNLVHPVSGIIPIHSEDSSSFNTLLIHPELKTKIITTSRTFPDTTIEII